MGIHVHWYLPTNGDSRDIVGSGDRSQDSLPEITDFRAPTIDYLGQVARSAEQLGYEAVLTPTGTWCEDAWIFTAALSQVTRRLKFLVAFRPGFISPTLAAHQAATFQRVSGGRLLLNIVTGGDSAEQRRYGDHLGHDQRYQRTEEFLAALRGVSVASPRTRSASPASTTRSRPRASASPRIRFRRSSSAARARRPSEPPPGRRTCTWPGARPRRRSPSA